MSRARDTYGAAMEVLIVIGDVGVGVSIGAAAYESLALIARWRDWPFRPPTVTSLVVNRPLVLVAALTPIAALALHFIVAALGR